MATYGADFYALTKYGTPVSIDFGVEPFTAEPIGRRRILIHWNNPTGTWQRLRLLQSRYGYAVTADDGEILRDEDSVSAGEYVAVDDSASVVPIPWRYYSLFIQVDDVWHRAGATSTLLLPETDTVERLLQMVPRYYRLQAPAELTGNVENEQLKQFVAVLGFGVDYLRTYATSLVQANDPFWAHLGDLESLATQFGIEYLHALPARLMRQRVANGALLAKQRGTWNGLRDVTALSVGFDIEVTLGPNLMLNSDQSSFLSPEQYPEWDSGRAYAGTQGYGAGQFGIGVYGGYPGDLVHFAGNEFECKAGALGDATKPLTDPVSNTWWRFVDRSHDGTLYNATTANLSTWQALLWTNAGTTLYDSGLYGDGLYGGFPGEPLYDTVPVDATNPLTVNVGATNDDHDGRIDANVLAVQNTSPYQGDVLVRSISYPAGRTAFDPDLVVRYGVPVPQVTAVWDAATDYNRGDLAIYRGRVWRAVRESQGARPPAATDTDDVWEALGLDRRIRMCLSAYTHGPLTGPTGTGGIAAEPYVALFDAWGNLLTELSGAATPAIYDPFTTNRNTAWASRVTDIGAKNWEVLSGTGWVLGSDPGVGYANPTSGGITVVDSGKSDCRIAVTLVAGQQAPHGLVFRAISADSYWSVSRTALNTATGVGGPPDTTPFPIAFVDGDRMMVDLNGPIITVYRNGTRILQISSSFNQTATRHGMFA